jgi:hypothetical protein
MLRVKILLIMTGCEYSWGSHEHALLQHAHIKVFFVGNVHHRSFTFSSFFTVIK